MSHRFRSWIFAVLRRARMEDDMDAELRFHIDTLAEDLNRKGKSRQEALRQARLEFGGMERIKEECRDARGINLMESVFRDVRFGLRTLRKSPGFTAVVVLSLGLGIGANTAVFTLLNTILFKMLPVTNPQQLALLQWAVPEGKDLQDVWYDGSSWPEKGKEVGFSFSYPIFQQLRAGNQVFSDLFAFADLGSDVNVVADGDPALAHAAMASAGIFSTLGVQPVAGRLFADTDDVAGAQPVCVISGRYWKSRFGERRDIVGKTVVVAGVPFKIIGVAAPNFSGLAAGSTVDLWVPLSLQPLVEPNLDPKVSMFTAADHWWIQIMGRLKPEVSREQAAAALNAIFQPMATEVTRSGKSKPFFVPSMELGRPGQGFGGLRNEFSRSLFVLMALVGLCC